MTSPGVAEYPWPLAGAAARYISPMPSTAYAKGGVRHLAILGCTGSIGRNAIAAVEGNPHIRLEALGAGANVNLLSEQAMHWRPGYLAVRDEYLARKLRALLPRNYSPEIVWGPEGYAALAAAPDIDCVLSAQAGLAGLAPTLAAALAGKVIALANKEALVLAGGLLRQICWRTGASILPVDSEHFALFQCLCGRSLSHVRHLILTASGGPFLHKSIEEMAQATPAQALNHPNWRMGAKISIDSATMMNKGLEVIEALQLFGVRPEQIQVLIQPQSIIHSLVEFMDNAMLAQLAVADMRLPITGCLLWPNEMAVVPPLNLAHVARLDFLEPDLRKFPCLALAAKAMAYEPDSAWRALGLNPACIALNGANDAAVGKFLDGKCGLTNIPRLVEAAIEPIISGKAVPAAPTLPDLEDPAMEGATIAAIIGHMAAQAGEAVEQV